jgi:hypothetical protein
VVKTKSEACENLKSYKVFSVQEKMDFLAQVDPNEETCFALAARVGITLPTLNIIVKDRKKPKSVTHNVAGSLAKGRSWNSHHFKTWGVCWPHGLNKPEVAMQEAVAHCWSLKILQLLVAGSMVSSSDTCLQNYIRRVQKCRLFNNGGMEKGTVTQNY